MERGSDLPAEQIEKRRRFWINLLAQVFLGATALMLTFILAFHQWGREDKNADYELLALLQEAEEKLDARDLEGARDRLELARFKDEQNLDSPPSTRLVVLEGRLIHLLRGPREALDVYNAALELDYEYLPAHLYAGTTRLDMKDLTGAHSHLVRARLLAQENPRTANAGIAAILINLGNVVREQGRLDEARELYERAIEKDPREPTAHASLGSVLAELRDYDGAIAAYARAAAAAPENAEIIASAGRVFYLANRNSEAEALLRRTLELRQDVGDYELLALIVEDLGRPDEAATLRETIRQLAPERYFDRFLGSEGP